MRRFLAPASWTILCIALLAPPAAGQQPATVTEVAVRGNKHMSAGAVLVHVKTRVGTDYDESTVRADEQRLLKTGRFDSVAATKTQTDKGVIVTFVVVERPAVARVGFEGNENIPDSELDKELSFGVSDPLKPYTVESGRQAIVNKYHGEGYHFAKVSVDSSALDRQQVIYQIVEGPKTSISKIVLEGNRSFSTLKLKQRVGSSARFWPFVPGRLDSDQVERDVHALRNFYTSEGFLDAEVDRVLDFKPDKKRVKLTFLIDEGQRYRIDRVIFRGNTVFSDAELLKRMRLKRGEFFTADKLGLDVSAAKGAYAELGYIEADVQAKKRFVDPTAKPPAWAEGLDGGKPALLNIVFSIVEADQYTIGRIAIRGNAVTQERVIRRELRFFPEQLFNTVAIDESRRRLLDTRLFEKVSINRLGTEPNVRNLLVQVTEGRTAEFLVGAGITTNSGVLGNISFTQRNFDLFGWPESWRNFVRGQSFKGAGQTLRVVAEPGTELMRFHIDWFEPYLFDKPYSLGTKVFMFTRGREKYDETRYGGVVSFGHRFKNRWYGEMATRIEGVKIDDLDSTAPPEVMKDAGQHTMLGLKGTLVRDRTDSRWMPTAGDRFRISFEQIVGGFNFGRVIGDYRIYRTLYVDALDRKHILSSRVNVGNIFGDAPVFERFYGGGIGSVRGFDYRGISPRSKGTDDQIGGEFSVFAGVEYGFPLVGEQLRGAVFIDTGTVEETFEITTYRAAAGVGLRWIIPMFGPVPMSLDFAAPISKDDQDDTQILSFSFGWTF